METIQIDTPEAWTEYELLDSGLGAKLERFSDVRVSRPDPRALWIPSLPKSEWEKAHAIYSNTDDKGGQWQFHTPQPNPWHIHYKKLTFALKPTEFKHMGVFPEQAVNWEWLHETIANRPLKILNLFAYTGGATLAASLAGAHVTHVDSIKSTVNWARENAELSQVPAERLRWIEEDAVKFVLREARRGNTYEGIIMDPPRFGRGSKGEVWKLADQLPMLLEACRAILSEKPVFFLINAYTADLSALVLHHLLAQTMQKYGGMTTFGELALKATSDGRLLPNGIYSRWKSS